MYQRLLCLLKTSSIRKSLRMELCVPMAGAAFILQTQRWAGGWYSAWDRRLGSQTTWMPVLALSLQTACSLTLCFSCLRLKQGQWYLPYSIVQIEWGNSHMSFRAAPGTCKPSVYVRRLGFLLPIVLSCSLSPTLPFILYWPLLEVLRIWSQETMFACSELVIKAGLAAAYRDVKKYKHKNLCSLFYIWLLCGLRFWNLKNQATEHFLGLCELNLNSTTSCCMALGKSFNHFEPQFPPL